MVDLLKNQPVAVLGLILTVLGLLISSWFTFYQRNLARRQRASDLFDGFYSSENYHAVVAPVYIIMLKWNALQGEERAAYAATLCKGWMGQDKAANVISAYAPDFLSKGRQTSVSTFEEVHFRRGISTEEITEHAALTSFLYFWVKVKALIDARLACKKLIKELFKQPYSIYAQFIANFREAMLDNPDIAADCVAWVNVTRELEALFLDKQIIPEHINWSSLSGPLAEEAPSP
jgi:hypothetical protein